MIWIFEDGSFVPCGRITETSRESIITDYLGTPQDMYNNKGEKTWSTELDIYGRVCTFEGRSLKDCPFRYQGQYQDEETGLYYNRFRYYDPSIGSYISKDPIGLGGGNPTIYGYVADVNTFIDFYGLAIVDATFTWTGSNGESISKTGQNPLDRVNRATSGINEGLSAPNRKVSTMHAEIEAMTKVKAQGASGGAGKLVVKGKNICPYCKGDVKKLAKQMNLDSLEIIDADGTRYLFNKKGLNPVRQGGMGYKKAKAYADTH